jgi:hypothetical protein
MLTAGTIKTLCDRHELFEVEPMDWRIARKRQVFASVDVHLSNKEIR